MTLRGALIGDTERQRLTSPYEWMRMAGNKALSSFLNAKGAIRQRDCNIIGRLILPERTSALSRSIKQRRPLISAKIRSRAGVIRLLKQNRGGRISRPTTSTYNRIPLYVRASLYFVGRLR